MTDNHSSDTRGVLSYPCGTPPERGDTREVAPGVQWIRMPLPSALTHINLWTIADTDGYTLIDTGVYNEDTTAAWNEVLDGPLAGQRPSRVIVTHMHPDHVGMAGWLTRRFECRLWMTRLEYLNCRVLVGDTGRAAPDEAIAFYRRAGWDENAIGAYRQRFGGFGRMTSPLPDSYRRIQDGEVIRIGQHEWEVVVGSGHTPEHACLYCPSLRLLISGDQVLPRISSNVSVHPTEPDADPLADWLASIEKIRQRVPNDVLVLPAHNEPFVGLHERLDRLASSQRRVLARLHAALQSPSRVIDVFGTLFARAISSTDASLLGLATGESIAHLNYLVARDQASIETDGDGVAWYRAR
ncbi:MBL fold metallo-hydrolase [Paraburkholderia sediminicola]|uniref:MBL fold metallo-hydrolase n=1 Tax=Paraburkholderia sediminicola TaxID=458836 RepID=UPI0038B9E65A